MIDVRAGWTGPNVPAHEIEEMIRIVASKETGSVHMQTLGAGKGLTIDDGARRVGWPIGPICPEAGDPHVR